MNSYFAMGMLCVISALAGVFYLLSAVSCALQGDLGNTLVCCSVSFSDFIACALIFAMFTL